MVATVLKFVVLYIYPTISSFGRGRNNKICAYFHKLDHMIDICFKKHGVPPIFDETMETRSIIYQMTLRMAMRIHISIQLMTLL